MHKLDALVLEVGSYNVNGSVRDHFHNFSSYTGVDFRPGPNVDEVCLAHDMDFDVKFDVVISSSMLEHDRHWRDSITNMESHLKDDVILLLSWGAANNDPHGLIILMMVSSTLFLRAMFLNYSGTLVCISMSLSMSQKIHREVSWG